MEAKAGRLVLTQLCPPCTEDDCSRAITYAASSGILETYEQTAGGLRTSTFTLHDD
jgi:hypothetical protein